jgi:cell division protein FtsB
LRLAALALLLVAAAFYVSPLRAFFAQQDRYDRQVAALAQARVANQTLLTQIERMHTRDFITRQAREQYQLVPAGLQAFVVKGLPAAQPSAAPSGARAPPTPPPPGGPRPRLRRRPARAPATPAAPCRCALSVGRSGGR